MTHGFLLDTDGQKMSKSLGNVISPQDVIKQSGADILRLWVSMSDYQEETRVSKEILARVAEAYRKIRNTLRYLLSNLYDFNPAGDAVERTHMEEVDQYILARYGDLSRKIASAYEAYDYSTIFQAVNAFITVDLSAFYADVSKDRLYTFAAGSKERRSAQTAMFVMTDGLARLLAPILSFSMEELWRYLPANREESVHLSLFPSAAEVDALVDRDLLDTWEHLLRIRTAVNGSLELLRKEKQIGTSLEAQVHITASGEDFALLQRYEKQLPMLFIVSEVVIERGGTPQQDGKTDIGIAVSRASGMKCERCWRYVSALSTDPAQTGICDRCQNALAEATS